MNDRADGQLHVCRIVNDGRRVPRADSKGGLPGRIGCLHHAGTAGGEDNVRFLHHKIRECQRRHIDPADDLLRRSGFHRCFQYQLSRCNRTLFRSRMRAEYNRISRLQGNQRLEDDRRRRICRRNDRRDHTDRLCDLFDSVNRIFFDHTTGLRVLVSMIDVLGGIVILDHLILHDTHTGLFHRHLRKRDTRFIRRCRRRPEDDIYLLLRKERKSPLRLSHGCHLRGQLFFTVDQLYCLLLHHIHIKPFLSIPFCL